MGKKQEQARPGSARRWVVAIVIPIVAGILFAFYVVRDEAGETKPADPSSRVEVPSAVKKLTTMDVNQAVMVTVEVDLGQPVPTVAEALKGIQRRYQPADGTGRTFAVIDATGEPTPDGKLRLSMHVSAEKAGIGSLVVRRTGEELWKSRIVDTGTSGQRFTGKNLTVLFDNGKGGQFTVDGSANPDSLLDANIRERGVPLRSVWPDGAEREVTFLYSACGCPVKVMVRREGELTVRASDLPVIFPDDPAVLRLITVLMGW